MAYQKVSRRQFIQASSTAAVAATFVPRTVWGANDRVNVACIGIGGKGSSDVTGAAGAGGNIVALADPDENRRVKGTDATVAFPKAAYYRDYREMLEKEDRRIDAVTVSTPDHTHCHAAVTAMRMGKHVYCQKPLSYNIAEARLMAETAAEYGVATQMGNQAHAGEPIRRAVELIRAGLIGKVTEVHAWTNRPIWPQGMTERPPSAPIPEGLDWDLWLGPAPYVEYAEGYCPFAWRGWWDWGTGAFGDMGCHIMDMPYWALDLTAPETVEADSTGNTAISGPTDSTVTFNFGKTEYTDGLAFNWYDGTRMPDAGLFEGFDLPPQQGKKGGAKAFDLVMVGTEGKFLFNRGNTKWQTSPKSLLKDFTPPVISIPRVENEDAEWIEACKGGAPALSNFSHSGPFTETVLLGNVAIRTGKTIRWDSVNLKAKGCPEADQYISREYRKGWEL